MLTDSFLSRLDTLSLAMRGRAQGGGGGSRRSRQTGSSAEFSDYREYVPGDDIRRLDWNAYARFDKLFLKLFMEEQESLVTVLLDASASMAAKWASACGHTKPTATPCWDGTSLPMPPSPHWPEADSTWSTCCGAAMRRERRG